MSEDGIISAKSRLLDLFTELDEFELDSIEQWICSHAYKADLETKRLYRHAQNALVKIADEIKKLVPLEAEFPSENINPPTVGDQADCNAINTCHVDEFLYDNKQVEQLVKDGKIKRQYCLDCNSHNTMDLIFISHSMSKEVLQYMFNVLLPRDLEDKQILDIGSRIGAVIFGAYYFSNVSNIVGVEMNKECCEVQEKIINQLQLDNNRIRVVHTDIMDRSDIISSSNIFVINVLDFFVDIEKHREMWQFFRKYIRKGSYVVTNRNMIDTVGSLEIFEDVRSWLSICKAFHIENEIFFDMEDCSEIFLYTVC